MAIPPHPPALASATQGKNRAKRLLSYQTRLGARVSASLEGLANFTSISPERVLVLVRLSRHSDM